jgi:NAD(P)H-dependent FMN reductase
MSNQDTLKISVIAGSHRRQSQTTKVARFAEKLLLQNGSGHQSFFCDLAETALPLWDEGVWSGAEHWQTSWGPISKELSTSDGLVLVTPEWGGMATPAIKNFLLLCSDGSVRHRPALIVAVSATHGGTYPVAELRMNSGKNSHLCFIPEHVIVRKVEGVLNDEEAPNRDEDVYLRERLLFALNVLTEYARAMRPLHDNPRLHEKKFRYGM